MYLKSEIRKQVKLAMEEANVIVFHSRLLSMGLRVWIKNLPMSCEVRPKSLFLIAANIN
jgi:hypothetical protein